MDTLQIENKSAPLRRQKIIYLPQKLCKIRLGNGEKNSNIKNENKNHFVFEQQVCMYGRGAKI